MNYDIKRIWSSIFEKTKINTIHIKKFDILYVEVPKIACSSIKNVLFFLETGSQFDSDAHTDVGANDIHQYYQKKYLSLTIKQFQEFEAGFKFAVLRDPIKRAISCYGDRVVFRRDIEKSPSSVEYLKKSVLPTVPDIDTFFMNLDIYSDCNDSIRHHIRPQIDFLGPNLDIYGKLYKIENLSGLEDDLSNIADCKIVFPRLKAEGPKFDITDLSEKAFDRLMDFTSEDYKLLGEHYDKNLIIESYRENK